MMKPLNNQCSQPWVLNPLGGVITLLLAFASMPSAAADTTPAEQLARFAAQAERPPSAERGARFFTSTHGNDWSCATCHRDPPTTAGRHASTGKRIKPLAPHANPQAFTRVRRVDKWFRRNCKDVVGRPCTAGEKADVLAWLMQNR